MEKEQPLEEVKTGSPVDYAEKIAGQQALVDKLTAEHEKKPTAKLRLELKQKTDALRHLHNLAKEDPKGRAKKAAETARMSVLSRVYA